MHKSRASKSLFFLGGLVSSTSASLLNTPLTLLLLPLRPPLLTLPLLPLLHPPLICMLLFFIPRLRSARFGIMPADQALWPNPLPVPWSSFDQYSN